MFDGDMFENWLDKKASEIVEKIGGGEQLKTEEMMVLALKVQSNHFYHLDKELNDEMKTLRIDMDRRFEQVDKRFVQVDKRFEQVDQRFDQMMRRMDRFMFWSLGITVASAVFVVNYLK